MGNADKNRIQWNDEETLACGLTLKPIRMEHYTEWMRCKRALTLRQSTLPAVYAVMPYLSALFAMDMTYQTSFIHETMLLLALATGKKPEQFAAYAHTDEPTKLAFIRLEDEGQDVDIFPKDYPAIREILAKQNGERLPDEGENPELVEAEQDILAARRGELDWNINTMLASVAYQYRMRKNDLRKWSISEFEEAREAIDRDKNHLILGLAERMPMVKFTHGNPVPSWCLNRRQDGNAAIEKMSDFMNRTGVGGSALPIQG